MINDDFYILVHIIYIYMYMYTYHQIYTNNMMYIHITNMMYGRSILNRFSDLRCLSKSPRKHGTNW